MTRADNSFFYINFILLGRFLKYAMPELIVGYVRIMFGKRPDYILGFDGGIGDHLMCTTVAHELKRNKSLIIWINSSYIELFKNNPDIDWVFSTRIFQKKIVKLNYYKHDSVIKKDIVVQNHILHEMCKKVGIVTQGNLKPFFYLKDSEKQAKRFGNYQVVIQTSGKGGIAPMDTKDWFQNRFQEVVDSLPEITFIQLGSLKDPKLNSVIDLRGKTAIRETASILDNSDLFVGQVGFLMHLSRALEIPAVIIYGGREHPDQSGYISNINLYSDLSCSPCWLYACPFNKECMQNISSKDVIIAIRAKLNI